MKIPYTNYNIKFQNSNKQKIGTFPISPFGGYGNGYSISYAKLPIREKTLNICRFHSSKSPDKLISLKEYLDRVKESQDKVYFLTGENVEKIKRIRKKYKKKIFF